MSAAPAIAPSPFLTGESGRVIDGKAVADTIRAEVAAAVNELKEKTGGKVRIVLLSPPPRGARALSRRRPAPTSLRAARPRAQKLKTKSSLTAPPPTP